MINNQRLQRAQDFIWSNARLIDRYLFTALFDNGKKEPVLSALLVYQNEDGGFGNALEPDIRCPFSQPQDVEVALRIMDAVEAVDQPTVMQVCDYLTTITTEEGGIPYAVPSVNDYPHPHWWTVEAHPAASLNPTAAIAGLLFKHSIWHPWLVDAEQFCWQAIAKTDETGFHTLIPAITFLEYVPDRERAESELQRIATRILQSDAITFDPQAQGYIKLPLDWAPTPQSYCRGLFDEAIIDQHLLILANRQQDDGGWPVPWPGPAISPTVELEWRGHLTIEALLILDSYGALDLEA